MFATANLADNYAKVGLETGVNAANPQKLILMLYEGALLAVADAKTHMLRNETAQKGESISKAITIIENGLKASLDVKAGGDIARNLSMLYDFMINKLLLANLKNKLSALDEVNRLLSELNDAWKQIGNQTKNEAEETSKSNPRQAAISYGKA